MSRLSKSDDGFIGWNEPDNSNLIEYSKQPYKHPSEAAWNHVFQNNPVYGRNYFLIFPESMSRLPKNQFILNEAKAYAFQDAWIKP